MNKLLENKIQPIFIGSAADYDKLVRNRAACKKYRENNKEKIKQNRKSLRSTDEFKNKRNKYLKEKRAKGCIKEKEYQKKYRLKYPGKIKEYLKRSRLLHPDKRKGKNRKDKENQRKNITNEYVKILLSNKLGIPYGEVKKYPKLIELHKEIIKIKRYAKQNKN